jgi:hypothetical protein
VSFSIKTLNSSAALDTTIPAYSHALDHNHLTLVLTNALDAKAFTLQPATNSTLTVSSPHHVRFKSFPNSLTVNQTGDMAVAETGDYDDIEKNILSLSETVVEKGAVQSALKVVEGLRSFRFAAPVVSWHGGDAIVLLWTLADSTYAMTITDGELGYVVRRNRKAVQMRDSIAIETLRLGIVG